MRPPFDQGDPLAAEWLALPSINSRQRARLEAEAVTYREVLLAGGLAWARISTTGRLWQPSDTGNVFLVQPVWTGSAPSIYQPVDSRLVDLIAWRADDPTTWFYRQGTPGAVLGGDRLDEAHCEGSAVVLYRTPLEWLRAQCEGTVLLEHCEHAWAAQREAERMRETAQWWGGEAA